MLDLFSRFVRNPWTYRITCAVVTTVLMILVGIGLRALKATHDSTLIYGVCIPFIAFGLLLAWWMDRKGWS